MSVSLAQAREAAATLGYGQLDAWALEQWRRGMEVELEHTADLATAARIALDHLRERADYYIRLRLVEGPSGPCDFGKGQWIRLADVFLIGPLMIWGGLALAKRSKLAGYGLAAFGVGTIGLNGYNYVRFVQSHRVFT